MKTVLHYLLLLLSWLLLPPGTNAYGTMPMNTTTPVCSDNEELFQLQFPVEVGSWDGVPTSYRIFTEATNVTHDECIMCDNDFPGGNIQMCLPRDQCHTVAVGRMGRWISCGVHGGGNELLVKWGDQTLLHDSAYFFESIDFGDGCQGDSYVDSYCDAENEILFEFFLERTVDSRYPLFSYALTEVATSENKFVHLEGEAPVIDNEYTFVYERKCVPRISCLEFYMGYPSNTTSSDWFDAGHYSIRLDGVIYSDGDLAMGLELIGMKDKLNQRTSLGNNCTVENMCNTTTEDLFEMEFTVAAPEDEMEWCKDYDYVDAIGSGKFGFKFAEQNVNDREDYYVWSSSYEDFKVNQTYAFISCIPNDECAVVSFKTENPVTGYKIFQNGEELTERVVHTAEDYFDGGMTTTNAGACRSGAAALSLVQGGVVASALAVLPLLLNTFW